MWQDLRYAIRTLLKSPGFTLVALIALALWIGANCAIFSIVNAVLLRPLPFKDPSRLVMVWNKYPKMGLMQAGLSAPDYVDRRDQAHVFERVTAYSDANLNLTGSDEPERIKAIRVTSTFFGVLGVQPYLGRDFLPEEDVPGHQQAVIMSNGLWKRRFGSNRDVVGKAVTLNGKSYTVVGVLPPGVEFSDPTTEMWIPIAFTAKQLDQDQRGNEYLNMIARLKPSITLIQAQADLDALTRRVLAQLPQAARDYFESNGWGALVIPLKEQFVGNVRTALLVLLGAVGFVLLIACANVANLLLARASVRQWEIGMRAALGASRLRLLRQLLTESCVLALLGGGLGFLLAMWGIDLLTAATLANLPRIEQVRIDYPVLSFALLLSLLTAFVFGLVPALHASSPDLVESLRDGRGGLPGGMGRNGLRQLQVVSQISLALVLLIGAGLMVRSFIHLLHVNPGFQSDRLLTMYLSLSQSKYNKPAQRIAFFQQFLHRLRGLPGVASVAANSLIPLVGGTSTASFAVEGNAFAPGTVALLANIRMASPGYFRTMGIPFLQGRDFTGRDVETAPAVVIVDERIARRFWPGQNPIGKRITFSDAETNAVWLSVVGVVADVQGSWPAKDSFAHIYAPYTQMPIDSMFVVMRTNTDPNSYIPAVRQQLRSLDPEQPIYAVKTMEQYVSAAMAQPELRAVLLAVFAGIALVLAAVGTYGVMAFLVAERRHEIGIRLALGAEPRAVLRMVVGYGIILTLAGLGIGLAGATALARILSGLLYGMSATDPMTFVALAVSLGVVSLVAAYVPARRATKVDPIVALRHE